VILLFSVPQELLDGLYIFSVCLEKCSKSLAESVPADLFVNACPLCHRPDVPLHQIVATRSFFGRSLGKYTDKIANFWPSGGSCWDALALISTPGNETTPGVILVEAKSHISEIYGSGCQASSRSRELILRSFTASKRWCRANPESDWTGPLYQSASRLAHLYFVRELLGCSAWLVNLCFLNDPIGPVDQDAWKVELINVKASLGLTSSVPFAIDVFLPALPSGELPQPVEHRIDSADARSHTVVPEAALIEMAPSNHAFQDNQITTREEDTEFASAVLEPL
jgi:hypothetical protein